MHLTNRGCRLRWRNRPANAPARNAIRLGHAIDHNGALAHAFDAGHGNVLRAVIKNVLVNFVGDAERIPAHAKVPNEFELCARKYFAGWIVWRIEDDRFRVRPKRRG